MHPEFAPVAFITAFAVLVPLPWHWRAGNVATLSIIAWSFASNMIYAVDAVIWAGNVEIVAPVWCDISTKIIIGANLALAAACLCICIHLEQVSSVRVARSTLQDKRRRQIFELGMCFGLPFLIMTLHYIVQGHRFDIIEDYGCRPSIYFSIPSIFIIYVPPIVMATGAIVFAGLALRHFIRRRASFAAHLSNTSALTTSRYLRLMLMSVLQMISSITVTAYTLWFTVISIPIRPWTDWADVHFDFSRIAQFPTLITPELVLRAYYVLWWMVPVSTWLFIAFFAFGHDAMEEYKKCFAWIRAHTFPKTSSLKRPFLSLPVVRTDRSKLVSSSKQLISHSMAPLSSSYTGSASSLPHEVDYDFESVTDFSTTKGTPTEFSETPTTASHIAINVLPPPPTRPRGQTNPFVVRPFTYPSTNFKSLG